MVAWWDSLGCCWGKTKKNQRCKLPARSPWETEPGNLYIPMTCSKHVKQEEGIRRKSQERKPNE